MKIIILIIFILIGFVGCDTGSEEYKLLKEKVQETNKQTLLVDKCLRACATEEEYNIPMVRNEVKQACYDLYYIGGEEAIKWQIEDCGS